MNSTNIHTVARERLFQAWRDSAVAQEAGFSTAAWSSRVHAGEKDGYVAGLHRGRLPAVELFQESDAWDFPSYTQGTVTARWVIRAHSGKHAIEDAEDECRRIIYAGLIKARDSSYFTIGEESVGAIQESPLGYSMQVAFTVETAADSETYETRPAGDPDAEVPDGGDVGGISFSFDFNDTSPVAALALPASQSIAGVQLTITTAFDGVGASLTVGIDGDEERYLSAAEIDVTEEAVYDADADDPGALTVKIFITPGTGATAGSGTLQITTTATA